MNSDLLTPVAVEAGITEADALWLINLLSLYITQRLTGIEMVGPADERRMLSIIDKLVAVDTEIPADVMEQVKVLRDGLPTIQ